LNADAKEWCRFQGGVEVKEELNMWGGGAKLKLNPGARNVYEPFQAMMMMTTTMMFA
jgi:hypothetical protein